MSISYVSKTFKSSPYVPPIDLGLMTKVLSYQQGKFDAQAERIQGRINQLGSLDVIKGEDREYLNNKINSLVSGINNLGGIDLSDINVGNQLDSEASNIYNDPNVISAISSTQRVRKLQASYEKYRTDPKLMKYWSEANYVNDMEAVNAYTNDGKVGSSYQGNSAATPYYDYNKEFQDAFKNITADQYSYVKSNGMYLEKSTGKYITPERVMSVARDLMTSQARSQMERDGNYLYKYKTGFGKEALVAKAIQQDNRDLSQKLAERKELDNSILLEQNGANKVKLKQQLATLDTEISEQRNRLNQASSYYGNMYDSRPKELMYMLYSGDYMKGLANRYSYNQKDNTVSSDPVQAMIYRERNQNMRSQATIDAAYNLQRLRGTQAQDLAILNNQLDIQKEAAKAGIGTSGSSGIGGNRTGGIVEPNTAVEDKEGYFEQNKAELANIDLKENDLKKDFYYKLTKFHPNLRGSGFDFNKDGIVSLDDFQTEDLGEWSRRLGTIIDPEASNLIHTALMAYDRVSKGEPINLEKFPKGIDELYENLSMLELQRDGINKQIEAYRSDPKSDIYTRNQYLAKTFSSDSKTQALPGLGLLKTEIATKADIGSSTPESLTILSVGKRRDQKEGYNVTYSYKDGKDTKTTTIDISDAAAANVGITKGPYDVLNFYVDPKNDFRQPIQNPHDWKFVGGVQVYQSDLNGLFNVAYEYHDNRTNSMTLVPLFEKEFTSPAEAYQRGKDLIQRFGADTPDKTNLKEKFEAELLNRK